uniref:Uncharacterized protein n=1 Tax=Plectus sambesii TaxID=2011161 RepID=A0A914X1X3_9BILA
MEDQKTLAESPSDQQREHVGTTSAATSSTSSSARRKRNRRKKRKPQDDKKEGCSNSSSTKITKTGDTVPVELIRPSASTSSRDNSHPAYTFGDQASRMVNAPVTGDISFGDNHNNSSNSHTNVTSHSHGAGTNLSGPFTGERPTIIQNYHNYGSSPSPSTSLSTPSQPVSEDWQRRFTTQVLHP